MENKEVNHAKICAQAAQSIAFLFINGFMTCDEHKDFYERLKRYSSKNKVSSKSFSKELKELP